MVPILTSRAFSVGPSLEPRGFSNCAKEANLCQERIQCLEKALGYMQTELDRLHYDTSSSTNKKRIQYDKITVWPSSPSVMIEDWVSSGGHWRPSEPPRPLPRTASLHDKMFRARSVAPALAASKSASAIFDSRATSAPPAPPILPIFRR